MGAATRLRLADRALVLNRRNGPALRQHSAAILAWALFNESHYEAALKEARLAVSISQEPHLSRGYAHYALGLALLALNRPLECLDAAREAADQFRGNTAAATRSDRFFFAEALLLVSIVLAHLDREDEALDAAQESVTVCAQTRGPRAAIVLAPRVKANLASRLRRAGRHAEALKVAREARELTDPLWRFNKPVYLPLRGTLNTEIGLCQLALGNPGQAVRDLESAVADLTGGPRGWEDETAFAVESLAAARSAVVPG